MVNELRTLLHESSDNAPYDDFDPSSVVRAGRSRNRRRRATMIGAAGLAAAAVIGSTVVLGALISDKPDPASPSGPNSEPVGPVLRLNGASPAGLAPAFEAVFDLDDASTDRYLDGVTEDGRAIVRDGVNGSNRSRLTLVDLAAGTEDPMPDIPGETYSVLEASEERIVYGADRTSQDMESGGRTSEARALVLDLANENWREMRWPDLPEGTMLGRDIGPDGRLYVAINADAEAMSTIDADGMTGDLWSVSLTDPDDVRDEDLEVGSFAIDDDHLVWSDVKDGISNQVTVRDLGTGEETSFDPQSGYCSQSSLGVDVDRIVMFQNCVTQNGVKDDRVQVVSMTGEPVVTIRDGSVRGYVDDGGHVVVTADQPGIRGVYSYDLATGDFFRLSNTIPSVMTSNLQGPVSDGWLMWTEGPRQGDGWVQKIAQLP